MHASGLLRMKLAGVRRCEPPHDGEPLPLRSLRVGASDWRGWCVHRPWYRCTGRDAGLCMYRGTPAKVRSDVAVSYLLCVRIGTRFDTRGAAVTNRLGRQEATPRDRGSSCLTPRISSHVASAAPATSPPPLSTRSKLPLVAWALTQGGQTCSSQPRRIFQEQKQGRPIRCKPAEMVPNGTKIGGKFYSILGNVALWLIPKPGPYVSGT